ncbi:hypothetical protein B2J93_1297 [Marssonina coronariae]|uniref:Uncharacterized protein n=1 Tax=Diplocarpon coronariae TaxID=2795749 RepID=A0A218Z5P5_9HELO|nr:hypothetical protein B2J93_1297 [Marssonina coronariae]
MTVNRTARDVEEGKSKIQDSHRLLRPRLLESPTGAVAAGYAAALDDGWPWDPIGSMRRDSIPTRRLRAAGQNQSPVLARLGGGSSSSSRRRTLAAPRGERQTALLPTPDFASPRHVQPKVQFAGTPFQYGLERSRNVNRSTYESAPPDPDAERAEAEGENDEDRS